MGNNAPARAFNEDTLIGGNILSLITSGMYTNPLAVYREYIQNSADSIASSDSPENGKVNITTDLGALSVMIRDNGPGLSRGQARRELVPVSRSGKHPGRDRGFRGLGRLAGLAFGKSVTFLTRCNEISPIVKVVWDGNLLRNGISKKLSAKEIILECVTIEETDEQDYPASFFEVKVEGLSRYAAASILNRDLIREYVGETCPVPFDTDFPYRSDISDLLKANQTLTLDIHIDEETKPVTRPYKNSPCISQNRLDRFTEFEKIAIPMPDNNDHAALGWIAHSSYFGALPKKPGTRCLRVRAGNIQIGDETVFDHLFSENRFNRWCVGEIHILDPRIVPNGRRDYFEPNVHLRNLENHLGAVCRKLEQRCRTASRERNRQRKLQAFLEGLETTHDLAASGYLSASAARQFIDRQLTGIEHFKEKCEKSGYEANLGKLEEMKNKLDALQASGECPPLPGVEASEVPAYKKIFGILAETAPSPQAAKETIEMILKYKPRR